MIFDIHENYTIMNISAIKNLYNCIMWERFKVDLLIN